VLEIGSGQGSAVAGLLVSAGLTEVEVRRDPAGHDRIAVAQKN
jgi:methylase of polypeptide subunit release factors